MGQHRDLSEPGEQGVCTDPQDARAEGGGGRLSQRDEDELQQAAPDELLQSKGKGRKEPLGLIVDVRRCSIPIQ